jgi:hypothetical protein
MRKGGGDEEPLFSSFKKLLDKWRKYRQNLPMVLQAQKEIPL